MKRKNTKNSPPRANQINLRLEEAAMRGAANELIDEIIEPFPPEIRQVLDKVERLFIRKNAEYQSSRRWDANFHDSAPVSQGLLSPIIYCMTLCAKQDDAFWKAVMRGAEANEREQVNMHERLIDGVVYRIIALALLNQWQKEQ